MTQSASRQMTPSSKEAASEPVAPQSIDDLMLLTAEERAEFEALMEDREAGESLHDFIARCFPHEPPPPHLRLLISLIERARHERIKVCVSWPPRHAKTVTLLRAICWWLTQEPADVCAYYSYSDKQAWSKSRVARGWALANGIELRSDSQNVAEWRTLKDGGVFAGGLLSGLTGRGVSGLFVVDDPFKNREEADSPIVRERIWEQFNEVVFTRLEGASVLVVHTRWHDDDLIGRLKKAGWEIINVPAIADDDNGKEPDPLGRENGEAMWPERFDAKELDDIKRQIGDWSFAALYQGRPRPRGAAVFKEPARCVLPDSPAEWASFLQGKRLIIGADPAATESTRADYSVAAVLAVDRLGPSACSWVLDIVRGQWEVPAFVERLRALQAHWRCSIVVEAVGGFKAVPQMLRQIDPHIRVAGVQPTSDKFNRSQGFAAAWNDGRVYIPSNRPWVNPLMSEVLSFTGVKDKHDDQLDAAVHAWTALTSVAPRQPRSTTRSAGPFG